MIGVYGGTFDPIHLGHLRTALEVKEALKLDQLLLIPCGTPAHRNRPAATARQRRDMVELALHNAPPGLRLDDRELLRGGTSYMVDTLHSLRGEYPNNPLCLIVGADAFRGLESWFRWETLFELGHLVVMGRPNVEADTLESGLVRQLSTRCTTDLDELRLSPAGLIYFVSVTQLAISATHIRQMVKDGANIQYLVADAVLEYIVEQGLYR